MSVEYRGRGGGAVRFGAGQSQGFVMSLEFAGMWVLHLEWWVRVDGLRCDIISAMALVPARD